VLPVEEKVNEKVNLLKLDSQSEAEKVG